MALYSLLLAAVIVIGAPYWLLRMATSGRYRVGLSERLGRIPPAVRAAASGRSIVWVHAVSVGEVLAATRLVAELESSLGPDWLIVISTTTATGQALARERFASSMACVFFYPLDFAFAVRAYLRALRPKLFVLMESELWPRMLAECNRAGIPVAVVNARVSDRSFARGMKFRAIWSKLLLKPTMFLAQSDEDARRLTAMGAKREAVRVSGNLKYDVRAANESRVAERIRNLAAGRPIIVAGSTHGRIKAGERFSEEQLLIRAWEGVISMESPELEALLVLAPRHPQRFAEVESLASQFSYLKASGLTGAVPTSSPDIILLDTIGDLAGVYGIATVAFIGGSLVSRGGHNPLEPAQFGVPVIMGPSYENFRDIVARLRVEHAIAIVQNASELEASLCGAIQGLHEFTEIGRRGQAIFEQQQGATARTVEALRSLLPPTPTEASR